LKKTIIDASKPKYSLDLKELFDYKDLFFTLAWRDLRVRYAQTFLGLFWAFIQPLATLLIFVLIFGKAIKIDTGDIPYPVFALSGMVSWSYFAYVLSQSGLSIIGAQEMVKKIYFPRLIIPLSKAATGFIDFFVTLFFLLSLMIFYGVPLSSNAFYLPVYFILNIVAALGIGIWVSSLSIRYRDFQHVVPFLVQFGLYATPIAYPASLIPEKYQLLYYLNPMAGVVEGYRWCILDFQGMSEYSLVSFIVAIVIFVSSLFYFKKVERTMSDLI